MKKLSACGVAFVLIASGCLGPGGGGNERTVLVDFSHDEFASFMIGNFPKELTVAPGQTVTFKQTWTGEPHTVTGGTLVNKFMKKGKPFMDLFIGFESLVASGVDLPEEGEEPDMPAKEIFRRIDAADNAAAKRQLYAGYDALRAQGLDLPDRTDPGDATNGEIDEVLGPAAEKFFEEEIRVPWAVDETEDGQFFVTQNAGQPCFLTEGEPPEDADEPCADAQQRQPTFDGSATYYNSGVIPYEGAQGNTFKVELSDDIEPGSYFFYCAVHGPSQSTEVKVTDDGSEVESQEAISRRARQEIAAFAEPMLRSFRDARDGRMRVRGETVRGPFGGVATEAHGSINEFVPRRIRTGVGEPVTWRMMGADHTITFGVPEYFPIIQFRRDGNVRLNPRLVRPAGGHPEVPEQEGEGVIRVDGGTYDGAGFYSSGLFGADPYAEYTLRFSKPGTYKYACLLHPPMVGTVEVR